MADNLIASMLQKAAAGFINLATKEISTDLHVPKVLLVDTAGNAAGASAGAGASFSSVPTTIVATVQRPNDAAPYLANDCWSTSTTVPTVGGNVLPGCARVSGGCGAIEDMVIFSSVDPATLLQGEIWIFDSAVSAVNDNAAFALSDADVAKLVTVVPFTLNSSTGGSGTNSVAVIAGKICDYKCVGSADLNYLIKVKNGYTPGNQEALTIRAKVRHLN